MMSIISLFAESLFMSKNNRLKAKFLDDSSKVKYYELLKLRIERKSEYKLIMHRLYMIKTGEYDRHRVGKGVCCFLGLGDNGFNVALKQPALMEGYKFWDKETCTDHFLIDIKDGYSPKMQYLEERYHQKNEAFYQARLELANYWLNAMTYVDNHF